MRILNALGLLVESPMKSIVDNSRSVNISNNWSSADLTRNMDEIIYLIRYLKEEGIINIVWTLGNNNSSDLFTNNVPSPYLNNNLKRYCVDDDYYNPTKGELCT